jgi:hypothetical protein
MAISADRIRLDGVASTYRGRRNEGIPHDAESEMAMEELAKQAQELEMGYQ